MNLYQSVPSIFSAGFKDNVFAMHTNRVEDLWTAYYGDEYTDTE